MPNAHAFVQAVWGINLGLLTFNMLPIYPLDGGQDFSGPALVLCRTRAAA